MSKQRVLKEIDRLIKEGDAVLRTRRAGHMRDVVENKLFSKWLHGCRNMLRLLGEVADAWSEEFQHPASQCYFRRAERMAGALESIQDGTKNGLLLSVEELVLADAFDSLLEQAEYLQREGFFLAAGVLGRAVLEEHLRKWAEHAECLPDKQRPTISDYTQSLYRDKHFTKIVLKQVESMAAVGNDAAHNKNDLEAKDVVRLLRDVRDFIVRYPQSGLG